jgi:hypothetical protein
VIFGLHLLDDAPVQDIPQRCHDACAYWQAVNAPHSLSSAASFILTVG